MSKKLVIVALIVLLAGTLMGFINGSSMNQENKADYLYNEMLSKIVTSIENGKESDNGEFSYMYPRYGGMGTSEFGYAYIQIDEDEQVLVVGENGTNEFPSILYDMYEVKNAELVHIFSGGERDRYYATDISCAFIEEGSSSADESFYDTFIVDGGIRMDANFYRAPLKNNIVLTPFVKQDSSEKQSKNKKYSIEVTDDRGIIKKCPKSAKAGAKVTIKTNSFMDAIAQINVNGNDIGKWNKNKTKYIFIMPNEAVKITTTLKSAGEW